MGFFSHPQSRSDETSFPPIERLDGEPVFRMFVLGTRGSGKTVFLASLYNQLKTQSDARNNFRVEASDEQRDLLIEKYDAVRNVDRDWPPGDVDATDYEFRCIHTAKRAELPIFQFRYADYPGGSVTKRKTVDNFTVLPMIRQSHTILVLIDGLVVLKKLKNAHDGSSLDEELDKVLDIVQQCIRRPLQFVLTKHDLLADYSLKQIRDVLFQNEGFSNIISLRRKLNIPTQLIPVSAVGANFAEWDMAREKMKKRPGAVARPYNIDLTLCFTITDALMSRFGQNEWPQALKARLATGGSAIVSALSILSGFAGYGAVLLDDVWLMRAVTLLQATTSAWREKTHGMSELIGARARDITDKNSAINAVMEIQHLLREDFAARNPESNLLA